VRTLSLLGSLFLVAISVSQVNAQSTAPSDRVLAVSETSFILPAMTSLDIEIVDPLNSKTSLIGTFFDIRLAEPVMDNGTVIIPAGISGKGEVIHSAKARAAGKAGELIIAARYLDYYGTRIPLRSFKYGTSTGKSNRDGALIAGAAIATPLVLIISGGNVDIPAGTKANAKTSAEIVITKTGGNTQ
jgi:hypothetical protein